MKTYKHTVQYYETDKMGITHHSNYIRMMEEARVDFFNSIGLRYDECEKMGIMSPVLSVECKYKKPTTFPDEITIETFISYYNGFKLTVGYVFRKDEVVVCEAKSEHCFVSTEMKVVLLKNKYPELDQRLYSLVEQK